MAAGCSSVEEVVAALETGDDDRLIGVIDDFSHRWISDDRVSIERVRTVD